MGLFFPCLLTQLWQRPAFFKELYAQPGLCVNYMAWPSKASLLDLLLGAKALLRCLPCAWLSYCMDPRVAFKCCCSRTARGIPSSSFPFNNPTHSFSLPQKQHISKFLPAATVLECIVVSQPLVFLHLQSFFNSPKLKQFVCSKFIQSLKLYWWLLIPFHQPTRDSQYSFHVIKLTLTYTQSTNLHIFRAYTQLHIIPSKSRT